MAGEGGPHGDPTPKVFMTIMELRFGIGPEPQDPDDALRYDRHAVWLRYRGPGVGQGNDWFSVVRRRWFLNRDGRWERELPRQLDSYGHDAFLLRTQYPYEEALRLAGRVALGEFDAAPEIHPPAR